MKKFLLALLLLATPSLGLAINLQPIPVSVGNIEGQISRYALFTERYGSSAGLIHAAAISADPNDSNRLRIVHVRETALNSRNFGAAAVVGSFTRDRNPGSIDVTVDSVGVAHIVWLANEGAQRHVYYARVSGATASGPFRVTPQANNAASFPRVAAARLSSASAPTPFIVYVGNTVSGGITGSDIFVLSGSPSSAGAWTGPVNLTTAVSSVERDLSFDLIDSLPTTGGLGGGIVAQGAVVYESGGSIFAIPTTGSGGTSLFFGSPNFVATGQLPSLAVQSLFGGANGYVGHVAYRGTNAGIAQIQYAQFAPLPTGSFTAQRFDTPPVGAFPGHPMIAVDPDTTVSARQNKRVSIAWQDSVTSIVNVIRNDGGLASGFGLADNVRPVTPFSAQGQTGPTANVRGGGRFGRTLVSSQWKEVVPVLLNGATVVGIEDAPPPTATPSPSPTPSISPTATATATISPTPSPSPTPTASPTATASPSPSPTFPGTIAPSPSPSISPTATPTITPTPTPVQPLPTPTLVQCEPVRQIAIRRILARATNCPPLSQDANGDFVVDAADIVRLLD